MVVHRKEKKTRPWEHEDYERGHKERERRDGGE